MAYEGYFNFGGVEIINTARTSKYVGTAMPTFGLADCTDCEGLQSAIGDEDYRSPVLDPAPWLDTSDQRTRDFWGVYPLGVTGVDDSTRQTTVTELIGDGAVTSLPRSASREIRYDVMLLGRTEAGVMAGFHWLNRALDAYRCGEQSLGCSGTELDFFSTCPPMCDFSACSDTIVEWTWNTPERVNWVPNSRPAAGVDYPWEAFGEGVMNYSDGAEVEWTSTPTGEAGARINSGETFGLGDTPVERTNLVTDPHCLASGFEWGYQDGTDGDSTLSFHTIDLSTPDGRGGYRRATINTPKTSGTSGPYYREDGIISGVVGDVVTVSMYMRTSADGNYSPGLTLRSGGTTTVTSGVGIDRVARAGVWTRYDVTVTATDAYDGIQLWLRNSEAGEPAAAVTIEWTMALAEVDQPLLPYFDGGSSNSASLREVEWEGDENESASLERSWPGPAVLQPAGTPVAFTVETVITSTPSRTVRSEIALIGEDGLPTGDVFASPGVETEFGFAENLRATGVATLPFIAFEGRVIVEDYADIAPGETMNVNRAIMELAEETGPYFDGFWGTSETNQVNWWLGEQAASPSGQAEGMDDITQWFVSSGGADGTTGPDYAQQYDGCPPPYNGGIRASGPGNQDLRLTRVLSGLIPGAWYRVETIVQAVDDLVHVSLRGTAYRMDVLPSFGFICGNSPVTQSLWFRADSPIMYLDYLLEAQYTEQDSDTIDMMIRYLEVNRATEDYQVYQTSFPDDGTVLNGWYPGDEPSGISVYVDRQAISYNDRGITGVVMEKDTDPGTIPGGQIVMHRQIRGLQPGVSYDVVFSGGVNHSGEGVGEVLYELGIEGGTSVQASADSANPFDSLLLAFSFTATSDAQDVYLSIVNPVVLDNGFAFESLTTLLYSFQVQGVETGTPPLPDGARDYRRTLYRVTALTGPTIEERFDKTCGFMLRVSFGLVAGVPHQFGPLESAGSALGGSSSPLDQIECIGEEAIRHNLISNPSWEAATSRWELQTAGPSYLRSSVPADAMFGTYGALIVPEEGDGDVGFQVPFANRITLTPGATYTVSVYARLDNETTLRWAEVYAEMDFYDAGGAIISTPFSSSTILTGDFQRFEATFTTPTTAVAARPRFVFTPSDDWGEGLSVILDGAMLETGGVATPYFDGSTVNAAWDGTANASQSTYTPSVVGDLIDPDCPPLPSPPAPPTIDEECIEDPTAWTRYTIYIDPDEIPLYSAVLPVVTMRTGDSTARQVRMRWYPNPDDLLIDDLPPCDYEGEVIVSYVPPNAVMEINAITRDAEASVNGGPDQPATQLLYGPDGGPMVWPELRCNQGYVFTVDVDAADDVSELDVLLSLGLKV